MIQIAFLAKNREVVIYHIENKVVTYMDRHWQSGIQILPMIEANIKVMENGRSASNKSYAKLIRDANTGQNLQEWQDAKDDEEVAQIIRKEAQMNGLIEIKGKEHVTV